MQVHKKYTSQMLSLDIQTQHKVGQTFIRISSDNFTGRCGVKYKSTPVWVTTFEVGTF